MSATVKLTCGHYLNLIDPLDDVPEEGPWAMIDSEDVDPGDWMTCIIDNRIHMVEEMTPGYRPLNGRGHPE